MEYSKKIPENADIIKVNGTELYFETYGSGVPLLLLHGWTQSSQFWTEYIPTYSKYFKVYAIDLHGHGKTTPLDKSFSIRKTAEDLLTLMDYLELQKIKAVGLSFGGLILLQLASLRPERIGAMVLIGTSPNYNGAENKAFDNSFSIDMLPIDMLEQLRRDHHFGEEQIQGLFDPELNYQINLSKQDLEKITSRVLIVNGDHDDIMGIDPSIDLYRNLPNANLWIVPDAGHIPISDVHRTSFLEISTRFLLNISQQGRK